MADEESKPQQPTEGIVDYANRVTKEFLVKHRIIPGDKNPPENTAASMRKKQGPGFWMGDIGE